MNKVVKLSPSKKVELSAQRLQALYEERETLASSIKAAEDDLLPRLGAMSREGMNHFYVRDMDVQVTTRIIRRLNKTDVEALPEDVKLRAFPVKRVLSLRELKWLKENDADTYKDVRATFKEAAGKAAIKIVPVQL